jgi:hypothetical protein
MSARSVRLWPQFAPGPTASRKSIVGTALPAASVPSDQRAVWPVSCAGGFASCSVNPAGRVNVSVVSVAVATLRLPAASVAGKAAPGCA